MNIIEDLIGVNKEIIPKSVKLTLNNWPIIFTGFVYAVILSVLGRVAFMFSILAGIIITLVQGALFSNYLYLIENIVRYGKIDLEDFKQGFKVYLGKIYGILVVIWFVNYGAGLFLRPILNIQLGFISLWSILMIAAFILLNCLPEVIYQKHYRVAESFTYAFEFMKENWLDWLVPNAVLFGVFAVLTGSGPNATAIFGRGIFSVSTQSIAGYIAAQLLLSFIMVYRGLLFNVLSTTSRRKRMFMRNSYKM
ncbi:hypothetical protein [Anaerosolibacter sp.]|uniref:hypothetical protein n=1 Tax=Anaerosolibacter sp. TaxID=1872527 RepID=UPI0039EFAD2B